jgi:hypothetical protein
MGNASTRTHGKREHLPRDTTTNIVYIYIYVYSVR